MNKKHNQIIHKKGSFFMHHKNIKALVRKQLKINYRHWMSLNKKDKKRIARMVLDEVVKDYDFGHEIKASGPELLGIENQLPTPGIMNLEEMEWFINSHKHDVLFKLNRHKKQALYLKDKELGFIDDILDDQIINKLLSYDGYSPSMRGLFPSNYLRAELLKTIKYPEISYRKFCGDDKTYKGHKANSGYIGMENKQNRIFIGLPLNKKKMISHVQMSQFRSSLCFKQLVNLIVYILYHFKVAGFLDGGNIHCVDSTELAIERQELLATLTIKGKKIRVYDDIDCDCGKRRTKRDKSVYVVGYRLHTLTAINANTGQSFPLVSLLAPANHHDSHFLKHLIQFGKAIGLDLRLITADEAYHDNDNSIYTENGVHLIRPPDSKVSLPANVDKETWQVKCNDFCEIPMEYAGIGERGHEYKCKAEFGRCPHATMCPGYRTIPIDNGYFQRILYGNEQVLKALEIRKNGERPFNLLKKREGLETVRVRSQHGLIVRSAFTTIVTLLLEMAGTRRKKKQDQTSFLDAVGF
jgi:hypothetical protein